MWDVELAKMFKERNNKDLIGPCIGKVVAASPLKISILDDQVVLQGGQLYITEGLTTKEYLIDYSDGDVSGNLSTSGSLTSLNIKDGKATLKFSLKIGDEVLLIPAASEQIFFVVDKVKKVGG